MTQTRLSKLCTAAVASIALGFSSIITADPSMHNNSARNASAGTGSGLNRAASPLTPLPANNPAPNTQQSTIQQSNTQNKTKSKQVKQVWNLQNADVRAVIHTISALTGKNFVIDPRVQGRVTIVSKTPMSNDQLYKVFLSMLQVLGYAAVPAGKVIKIVPAMNAKEYAGTQIVKKKEPVGNDQVILKVVPVYNVSAAQLVPILRPLMHEWGSIMAYTPSNTLILAGSADNVARLTKIVHNMDDHNASEIQEVELKNANAEKLVKVLNKLQQDNRAEGKVTNVSFAADAESNSVLISGSVVNIAGAKTLIRRLDIKAAQDGGGIRLVHLKFLRAKNLVPVLVRLIGGKVQGGGGAAAPVATSSLGDASTNGGDNASSTLSNSSGGSQAAAGSESSPLVAGGTKKASIVAEESNNSVLISAPAQITRKLLKVIRTLDVRPMQVLVEAIIVRVDEEMMRKLGVQWGTVGLDPTPASQGGQETPNGQNGTGNSGANIGFHVGTGFLRGEDIKGLLTALQNDTKSQILATPSVVVLNNQKALISQGENVGLQNRSYATSDTGANLSNANQSVPFTTLQRTDVTLKLTVTPQISPNNTIMLKIVLSDRELGQSSDNQNSENPKIATSLINTGVLVNSKDILVLGGLIRNQHSVNDVKVPILGDIPYFGRLFTYRIKQNIQRNLMVFLKPAILRDRLSNLKETSKRYNFARSQQIKYATDQTTIVPEGEVVFPAMRTGHHPTGLPAPFPMH
ncbi:MAG: type II secretion system secretin GspD [Coxiellaceae bacterium]|nr:type II secretion system secretin GspD [Coxiellaceae bacterium]